MSELGHILEEERVNAGISWGMIAFFAALLVYGFGERTMLWMAFVASIVVLALVPAVVERNLRAMVPWEVLLLAALPIIGSVFDQNLISVLSTDIATYISVATIALITTIYLHTYTEVEMTHQFAITFVILATLAVAGVWAVLQYASDIYLGTSFLSTNTQLMRAFMVAAGSGAVSGIIFEVYFRQRAKKRLRPFLYTEETRENR